MRHPVIPSGSFGANTLPIPSWAKPTEWWGVEIGCLARVLPLGGPDWVNEIVLILGEESQGTDELGPRYRVIGRKGTIVLPYYALSVERNAKNEL